VVKHGVTEFLEVFESDKSIFFDIETDLLVTLDEGGNILRVNPAFTRILGFSETDVMNQSLILFLSIPSLHLDTPQITFLKKGGGEVNCRIVAWKYKHHQHYAIFRRC
jgi:PAS domain S-box-containing protein